MEHSIPVALTIAGSDCCAGAGLQADLKTFSAFGVHGLTAVTAVVAETPLAVEGIYPVEPAALQEQIRILLEYYPVAAIKIGMLGSALHVVAVAELLADVGIPLVIDPVMVATSGEALVPPEAVTVYRARLLPLATVMTPNLSEARALLGDAVALDPETCLKALRDQFDCAVLLTGGHESNLGEAVDRLLMGDEVEEFRSPWLEISSSHGTGCTLSAAIAAGLALGSSLRDAVVSAKEFIARALAESYAWTSASGLEIRAINQLPAARFHSGVTKELRSR